MKHFPAVLLVLPAACAVPRAEPPAPAPAPEPAVSVTDTSVSYAIELVDPARPLVRLRVAFAGDTDGESELAVERPGGSVAEPGQDLELAAARADGRELAFERLDTWRWRVHHAPGAAVECTFELDPTPHRGDPNPRVHYQPIVEPGLVHLIGSNALPAPEHFDGDAQRTLHLRWIGFEEAGWETTCSHGGGARPLELSASLDRFRHAVFIAGKLQRFERDVHGAPVEIAVYGDDWATPLEEFADLAERIVALEREFFGEFERPFYLISLIPIGKREAGVSSMGGTGLTNSFALFLLPGSKLADDGEGSGMSVPWLLAHEMFHDWNGHAIRLAQPERLGYWFSEGFTDFYARRLLTRAGLMSLADAARSWNEKFTVYATNPERNAPAVRVADEFWNSRDVGNVPYQRGDLVALWVDHAIREKSGGARSLDDLMRDLVRRAREGGGPLSVDELLAAIESETDAALAAAVRKVVVDGADIELPRGVGAPELVLVDAEVPRFDLGFDHERTLAEKQVHGVRPGSAAEAAGLRDGMQALSWSVHLGDAAHPVEMRVRDGDQQRTITFLPAGAPVRAFRFDLNGSSPSASSN